MALSAPHLLRCPGSPEGQPRGRHAPGPQLGRPAAAPGGMFKYAEIHIHIFLKNRCVYVCIYVYVCMCTYIYTQMCVYIGCLYIYMCVCTCLSLSLYLSIYIYRYVTYGYVHMHVSMCVYIYSVYIDTVIWLMHRYISLLRCIDVCVCSIRCAFMHMAFA